MDKKISKINLKLFPGKNQYKFVVHTRKTYFDNSDKEFRNQIWTHDVNSKMVDPDSFGGYNSVLVVQSTDNIAFFIRLLLIGLLLFILFEL